MPDKKDEWGNIELPGISDQELLNKNWNLSRKGNINYQQSIEKRQQDPTYIKKQTDGNKEARLKFDPIKHSQSMKDAFQDPKNKESYMKGREKMKSDPTWQANNKKITDAKKMPTVSPDGKFDSLGDMARFYKKDVATIVTRMKRYPDLYYYSSTGPGIRPEGMLDPGAKLTCPQCGKMGKPGPMTGHIKSCNKEIK